jgi:hypothetical protein
LSIRTTLIGQKNNVRMNGIIYQKPWKKVIEGGESEFGHECVGVGVSWVGGWVKSSTCRMHPNTHTIPHFYFRHFGLSTLLLSALFRCFEKIEAAVILLHEYWYKGSLNDEILYMMYKINTVMINQLHPWTTIYCTNSCIFTRYNILDCLNTFFIRVCIDYRIYMLYMNTLPLRIF